jgi:hypothetical protein
MSYSVPIRAGLRKEVISAELHLGVRDQSHAHLQPITVIDETALPADKEIHFINLLSRTCCFGLREDCSENLLSQVEPFPADSLYIVRAKSGPDHEELHVAVQPEIKRKAFIQNCQLQRNDN